MKVSIIVPVYNVEKYVVRCFESIVNQSYKNIECIFIDDCSPDNSDLILTENISKYNGSIEFKLIRHKVNCGLSVARNTGTKNASGDYIYYLDSDDEITTNCIVDLVGSANQYPGVDIVQGNTKTIPQPKNDWLDICLKNFPKYSDDALWIKRRFLLQPRIPVNAWNKLLKRDFIVSNNLFFRPGVIHEDEHWVFYVAKKVSSIAFVDNCCYLHYVVPGSIMQSKNTQRSFDSFLEIVRELNEDIDPILSSEQRKFCFNIVKNNIYKINTKSDEMQYYSLFVNFSKQKIGKALVEGRFFEFLAYLSLVMPCGLYNNFFVKKFTRVILNNFPM